MVTLLLGAPACAPDKASGVDSGHDDHVEVGCGDEDIQAALVYLCASFESDGYNAGMDYARWCSYNFGPAIPVVKCDSCAAQGDYKPIAHECWGPAFEQGYRDHADPDCDLLDGYLEDFYASEFECE